MECRIFAYLETHLTMSLIHKIKMAAIGGGLCTEVLWRGYRFAMNDIKKSKRFQMRHIYIQSSNANARVLLNLSIFWLVFIIPGELVLDDCIYASSERFWISYSVTLTSP